MPVARIITSSPAESDALRRQLIAAGYSVKFAAPDEDFSDADIVVAAANVHVDYALQYAGEVAAEADADVIVAPGVVAGSQEREQAQAPPVSTPDTTSRHSAPIAGPLFGAAGEAKAALSESSSEIRETLAAYRARVGGALLRFRQDRELAAERKRLEREHRDIERQEQRRVLQQQRLDAEAQMSAERERLRLQRQAEQERVRLEQQEMRRAMEAERARLAAERERIAPTTPVVAPPVVPAPSMPAATIARPPVTPRPAVRRTVVPTRPVMRRPAGRDRRFQRAAIIASVVALVAMVAFALALNLHPSSPMPHSMVQNPVQEKSPFGAASITPVNTTIPPTTSPKPAALPQHDAIPAPTSKPAAKPSPSHTRRASRDNYVAEDEVVIHHYGQTVPKHPPAAQTQAGIRKYSDRD